MPQEVIQFRKASWYLVDSDCIEPRSISFSMDFFMNDDTGTETNIGGANMMEENSSAEHGATTVQQDLSLGMVMTELQSLKLLLKEIIDKNEINHAQLSEIKITCNSLEISVKRLENKELGDGDFTNLMQSEPNDVPPVDLVTDVNLVNEQGSWSQSVAPEGDASEPYVPGVWLGNDDPVTEPNNPSDFRRKNGGMRSRTPVIKPKRLFQSTPPQSSGKGKQTNSKGKKKMAESSSKKAKHSGGIIPPGKDLVFRPTSAMDLSREEKQACAYLFQRSKNIDVMGEKLVKAGEFSATREDLMCLQPGRSITDLVITLMSDNIREAQKHKSSQAVWCLPPSFEVDFGNGMKIDLLTSKYCAKWMPPYPDLKFIYVPMQTSSGHWYLMLIHIHEAKIYHLDSNCPVVASPFRKTRINALAAILHHIVLDPDYTRAFRGKRSDFMAFEIDVGRGIPCTFNSTNSGVWLLEWLSMEQFFVPDLLCGVLDEKEVRMKSAATLLLGPHNDIRVVVEESTSIYIKGDGAKQPPPE